jgi:hypothetical protein
LPAAQGPLPKLTALTHDDLPFSGDDWAAFFLAMRPFNSREKWGTFGMLRIVIGDEMGEDLTGPDGRATELAGVGDGRGLLESAVAIKDCPACARAAALLGQFGHGTV